MFLSHENREIIKAAGKSLEQFFEDLMEMYRIQTMSGWRSGCFFHDYVRVCIVRADLFDDLVKNLKSNDLLEFGREMGKKAQLTFKNSFQTLRNLPDAISDFDKARIEHFNKRIGWGRISYYDDLLLVEHPILSGSSLPFFWGYLEGYLSQKLNIIESHVERQLYRIEK